MGSWVNLVILVGLFVAALAFLYQMLPSKALLNDRPSIALFPKYYFPYQYTDKLKNNLLAEGFVVAGPNRFVSGNHFSDFWSIATKLRKPGWMEIPGQLVVSHD